MIVKYLELFALDYVGLSVQAFIVVVLLVLILLALKK